MGYEVTYKLKKEDLDPKFVPLYKNESNLNYRLMCSKILLTLEMMKPMEDSIYKTIQNLYIPVCEYVDLLLEKAKLYIYSSIEESGEVYFCGRNISMDITRENYISRLLEDVCLLKCIDTPNYFTDEDNYNLKYERVSNILDIDPSDIVYTEFREKYADIKEESY